MSHWPGCFNKNQVWVGLPFVFLWINFVFDAAFGNSPAFMKRIQKDGKKSATKNQVK